MLRYQFLQGVLSGESDERLILADKELGDEELASWCRKEKQVVVWAEQAFAAPATAVS